MERIRKGQKEGERKKNLSLRVRNKGQEKEEDGWCGARERSWRITIYGWAGLKGGGGGKLVAKRHASEGACGGGGGGLLDYSSFCNLPHYDYLPIPPVPSIEVDDNRTVLMTI